MDINDPIGVKALLDSLQASQAWKTATGSESSHPVLSSNGLSTDGETSAGASAPESTQEESSASSASSATVASLLAQLKSDPNPPPAPSYPSFLSEQRPYSWNQDQAPSSFIFPAPEDRREYSYKQSLPVLAELSQDPGFIEKINQLKKEQDDLERLLWEQRAAVRRKYEDKITAAKTKASIIGAEMTKHEADMLSDAYKKELDRFDAERVLPLWDNMVAQQQERLLQAGVPTMFITNVSADRERQQRIIKVMEDLSQ